MSKTLLVRIAGIVFIAIGLLGFVNNPILGLFAVNGVHNIVHILSGVVALIFSARGERGSATFGKIFAVVYGLVTVLGFVLPGGDFFGLMTVNMADNILHLALTAAFAYIGFTSDAVVETRHTAVTR